MKSIKNYKVLKLHPTLSEILEEAVTYLTALYEKKFSTLLEISFKEMLNKAQTYVFQIKAIIETK